MKIMAGVTRGQRNCHRHGEGTPHCNRHCQGHVLYTLLGEATSGLPSELKTRYGEFAIEVHFLTSDLNMTLHTLQIDLLSDDEITARINMADANFSFQVIYC